MLFLKLLAQTTAQVIFEVRENLVRHWLSEDCKRALEMRLRRKKDGSDRYGRVPSSWNDGFEIYLYQATY